MPNLVFVLHFFNRDASAEYFFPPFSLIRPFCSNYIISGVAVFEWISRMRADGKYLLCTLRLLNFRSLQWNNIQSIYSRHEMCTGSYFVSARKHERIAMKWNYKNYVKIRSELLRPAHHSKRRPDFIRIYPFIHFCFRLSSNNQSEQRTQTKPRPAGMSSQSSGS